jgi:nucleoside diphosphate kinase
MPRERTFIMIKPDGVQRGLVSKIIARFEEKGFKLVGAAPPLLACSGVSCARLLARARLALAAFDAPHHPRQVALKLKQADKALLEEHYGDLKSKPFFPGLVEYMLSGPVVPMVSSHPCRERASGEHASSVHARAAVRCAPAKLRPLLPWAVHLRCRPRGSGGTYNRAPGNWRLVP